MKRGNPLPEEYESDIFTAHVELPERMMMWLTCALKQPEERDIETLEEKTLTIGHSPDADDAFMFYALARERFATGGWKFKHVLQDIDTLNRRAHSGDLDITAISMHTYPFVADKYALLKCGASIGDNYGPVVVSPKRLELSRLNRRCIAIPGETTTAYLVLRLCIGEFEYKVFPFDRIIDAVKAGQADAGLIIHEGQLTYGEQGLKKVVDLGQWWKKQTGLPLPLGVNVIRKSLGPETIHEVAGYIKRSIEYALDHRDEALEYALSFARDLEQEKADRFVAMYVNDYTVSIGKKGAQAVSELMSRSAEAELIPSDVQCEFFD